MNKERFLKELERYLRVLSIEDQREIISDYREYFESAKEVGKSDEEIINGLDSPKEIARKSIEELTGEEIITDNKNKNTTLFVILQIVNVMFVLPILTSVIPAAFGIFVAGISVVFAAFASPIVTTFVELAVIAKVSLMIGLFGLGFLLINSSLAIGYYGIKLGIKYIKWNITLLRGY